MKRTFGKAAALSAAVAIIAFAGCGKDKKKTGEVGQAGSEAGGVAGASSAFAVLPANSNFVFGLSFTSLRGSQLWKQFMPMIKQQAGAELQEMTTACGFDPFLAVDSLTVGGNIVERSSMIYVVKGKLPKAKVTECMKALAQKDNKELKVEEDGEIVGFTSEAETFYAAWPSDSSLVISGANDKEKLKAALAGKESAAGNKPFMELVKKTDQSATMWFALLPPADNNPLAGMPGGGAAPSAAHASVNLASGLSVDAGARYASAEEAKKTAEQVNQMVGPMKDDPNVGKYLSKLAVTDSGNNVAVKLSLDQAEFDELIKMLQQQLPMLMMMMGGGM
jgi:hypothetical protein